MLRKSLALLTACCLLSACQNKEAAPAAESSAPVSGVSAPAASAQGRPQSVSTTISRVEDVPIVIETQGSVVPLDEVDLRPQKNGMITAIHFTEGQEVRRGQLMFSMDSRDDDANVGKAEAGVASAEAQAAIAERDLKRAQEMSEKQFISPSALDTARNKTDTALANLGQARASLEQARVGRTYTRIVAPFNGRAGVINVRPGSLVTSNSTATALVRLTRMDPIGVSFSISERDMGPLLVALRKGPVKLSARTNAQAVLKGEVSFVDSSVDRASGTLLIKGRLENKNRLVWPGQYLSVKLEAGKLDNAVVLPAQAVVNGPNGRFVYVVQDDQTVQPKNIELQRIADQRAVVSGIPAGVKVVLEGTQNLRPGVKITETKGDKEGKGKRAEKASDDKAAAQPTAAANTAGGVEIPPGFTPRDPDRWATASDEQKREILARWRERQALKAAAQ
ncbi:efflux RND transporter periplasmic adaptor subunit [Uliginosibacterium sp. 31-12]|uniref:efflux RND transporter periplasmic adaptor subunit n=1 Tax=Uliginosibacterium sp. 31-12 TaxID=3062781 RepID=UPI0026E3415D|nr:efflux RND transporter periplasmic adaptor subunit [Uliginosibacterium sp. 31-12]MDO6387085.1 efflux RND transporter periplasmic adaptor subunit [Uliginosibacterium sp. 31-12]